MDIYLAIFLDGQAFAEQSKGKATSALDTRVANLHCHMMPTIINVPYDGLTGEGEPLTKEGKTLDSGLDLGISVQARSSPPMAPWTTPTPPSPQSEPRRTRPDLA